MRIFNDALAWVLTASAFPSLANGERVANDEDVLPAQIRGGVSMEKFPFPHDPHRQLGLFSDPKCPVFDKIARTIEDKDKFLEAVRPCGHYSSHGCQYKTAQADLCYPGEGPGDIPKYEPYIVQFDIGIDKQADNRSRVQIRAYNHPTHPSDLGMYFTFDKEDWRHVFGKYPATSGTVVSAKYWKDDNNFVHSGNMKAWAAGQVNSNGSVNPFIGRADPGINALFAEGGFIEAIDSQDQRELCIGCGELNYFLGPNVERKEGETCVEIIVKAGNSANDATEGGCAGKCGKGCSLGAGWAIDCLKHDVCVTYKNWVLEKNGKTDTKASGFCADRDCGDEAAQTIMNCYKRKWWWVNSVSVMCNEMQAYPNGPYYGHWSWGTVGFDEGQCTIYQDWSTGQGIPDENRISNS